MSNIFSQSLPPQKQKSIATGGIGWATTTMVVGHHACQFAPPAPALWQLLVLRFSFNSYITMFKLGECVSATYWHTYFVTSYCRTSELFSKIPYGDPINTFPQMQIFLCRSETIFSHLSIQLRNHAPNICSVSCSIYWSLSFTSTINRTLIQ